MSNRHTGVAQFATADINLASALLTVGFEFFEGDECHIIATDSGGVIGRFNFYKISFDGKHDASKCSSIFAGGNEIDEEFSIIADYTRNRPLAKMSLRDWMDYACDDAKKLGAKLPSFDLKSFEAYVAANPSNVESLYFAYACNRQVCVDAYKKAKRYHQTSKGSGMAIINCNAPKHLQKELLGRL